MFHLTLKDCLPTCFWLRQFKFEISKWSKYNVSMIQRRTTFFLGIFIFLIPFLGFPTFWKTVMITLSGLFLIAISIKIVLPRKNTRPKSRREKVTPVFVENIPIYPKDDTLESTHLRVKSEDSSEIK